jgi:nucleoside-diphosphate-sugar epimerase
VSRPRRVAVPCAGQTWNELRRDGVLVTGAYGLIGHAVVERLRREGRRVVATDRLQSPPADSAFKAEPMVVIGVGRLTAALKTHRIDTIVHAAGLSGPMLARKRPREMFSVNAGGTLDLYEAARRAGVRRVILLSSAAAYGRNLDPLVNESAPLLGSDPYAASKVGAEAVARAYAASQGVASLILRPCWVYGARRRTDCILRRMVEDAVDGRPTRLPYGQGFPRQFIHVSDVAAAVDAAVALEHSSFEVVNLSDGSWLTLDEAGGQVRSRFPGARITLGPLEPPDDEALGRLDLSRAKAILGWRPSVPLVEGLSDYIYSRTQADLNAYGRNPIGGA